MQGACHSATERDPMSDVLRQLSTEAFIWTICEAAAAGALQ